MRSFPKVREGAGRLGLNAGQGVVFARWTQTPWAARNGQEKLLEGTSLSPALSQPLPDVVGGKEWRPSYSDHVAGGRGRGWRRGVESQTPGAGGPLQPCCFLSDDEAPFGEASSLLPTSRHFARDLSQASPAGGVSTCSGVPSFRALEGASDPCASGWDLEAGVRARPRRTWGADGLCSHPLARFSPNGHYGFARPRRPVLSP